MVWKKAKLYLIVASVALNVAFVAMGIAHSALSQAHPKDNGQRETQHTVWCPLHRELAVTDEQWTQIEPRLQEFQAAVGELCQQAGAMRLDVIDLIAVEEPDSEAIRAKQDEISATKRRIQELVAEQLLAERQILTANQQAKLFEMLRNQTICADGPPMSGRAKGGPGPARKNPNGNER